VLGAVFAWLDIKALYGIAVLAGGLGAIVSVLQRMTTGRLNLNHETAPNLLTAYGAVRPLVGAVLGMAVFAAIYGGLVPVLDVPQDNGEKLAFFAALAFLGGFNERFAQDMLARSSRDLTHQDDALKAAPATSTDRIIQNSVAPIPDGRVSSGDDESSAGAS